MGTGAYGDADGPSRQQSYLGFRELIDRYADAACRRDWEAFRDCWMPDAVWELGPPANRRLDGRDSILADVTWRVEENSALAHFSLGTVVTARRGDQLEARTLFLELGHREANEASGWATGGGMMVTGIYHDLVVCGPGPWRFARRYLDFSMRGSFEMVGLFQALGQRPD